MKTLKVIRNLLIGVLSLFAFLFALVALAVGPDTAFRMFYYNFSDIDDYKIFPSRTLHASEEPYRFQTDTDSSRVPTTYQDIPLDTFLEDNGTARRGT